MSQIKTLNGVQYTLPQYNDTAWGANTGNVLTQYLAAIADVTLQLSGGSFTLTAETDFGASFGLKALYLKSETTNPASAGVVRLAKTDSIAWRNNANGADKLLSIDASDNLQYAATKVLLSGAVVNADINASAAIAYSKLNLAASIVNADIASGAAIAYSKLALTGAILNADLAGSIAYSKLSLTGAILNADLAGSIAYSKLTLTGAIVNADISTSAAIAMSKLAALGTAKALQSNASTGAIEVSSVTNTELGYLSGVTSAIQTQLNATIANPLTSDLAAGSHKITGLAAATAAGNAVRFEQLIIVQGKNASFTATDSTTSSTPQSTSTTITITPTSASNKILIIATGELKNNVMGTTTAEVSIFRGATEVSPGNMGGGSPYMRLSSTTAISNITVPCCLMALDAPATTSPTTYLVKLKSTDNTSTVGWGGGDVAEITVLEVAGF